MYPESSAVKVDAAIREGELQSEYCAQERHYTGDAHLVDRRRKEAVA
jgi:hypothetical protein